MTKPYGLFWTIKLFKNASLHPSGLAAGQPQARAATSKPGVGAEALPLSAKRTTM